MFATTRIRWLVAGLGLAMTAAACDSEAPEQSDDLGAFAEPGRYGAVSIEPAYGAYEVALNSEVAVRFEAEIEPESVRPPLPGTRSYERWAEQQAAGMDDDVLDPNVYMAPWSDIEAIFESSARPWDALAKLSVRGRLALSRDGRELRFRPASYLKAGELYAVLVTGLFDRAGAPLPDAVSFFETTPLAIDDPTPPTIIGSSIPFGDMGVDPFAEIAVEFARRLPAERVSPDTVKLVGYFDSARGPITEDFGAEVVLEPDGKHLRIEPYEPLPEDQFFAVKLSSRAYCQECEEVFINLVEFVTVQAYVIDPPPTFRVKSVTPSWGAKNVSRSVDVQVEFAGGTVDCNSLKGGFSLAVIAPDVGLSSWVYDGHNGGTVHCNASLNRASLEIPATALLHGAQTYKIFVFGRSTTGATHPLYTSYFRTKNPGIKVDVWQIGNTGHDCELFWDACDYYLVSTATDGTTKTDTKLPTGDGEVEVDDWETAALVPSQVFYSPSVGDVLYTYMTVYDEDCNDCYKDILSGVAKVGDKVGSAIGGTWGGIIQAASKILGWIASLIPSNSDDFEGSVSYTWTVHTRWGSKLKLDDVHLQGGHARLWIRSQEFPPAGPVSP